MALPNIERNACGENFGQAQIIVFADIKDSTAVAAASLTEADAKTLATWTAKIGDSTFALSPLLYNPTMTAGGELTWGGGNATPDGKTFTLGKEPSEFTAELRKATASQQASMEELVCMAEADRLGCYIFDDISQVMGKETSTGIEPIKVKKVFVSDLTLGGREEPDYNSLSLQFEENWSASRKVVELTDFRGADLITATV